MYVILVVMVVVLQVPAPARIIWGAWVLISAEKKINYGTGFEQAINAWLIACAGDDLLSQPPFDTINPNVINEFRSRCKRHGFDILPGIADAMVVWIRNDTYIDPYPSEEKARLAKRNEGRSMGDKLNDESYISTNF